MEKKKQLILLVLKLLETESDSHHPLTQTSIAETISKVYPCDRKTVGRNIQFLKEMGYPIIKTTAGFFMDKKRFTIEEIEFVKNAILSNGESNNCDNKEFAERVIKCLSEKYSK